MNKNESKYFNTAKKMNDALLFLLEKKQFEYITIKDVCQKANVNRSTFYLHYDNLNDLLDETISQSNKDFFNAFSSIEMKDITKSNPDELNFINDRYLLPYLNFVKEHKRLYKEAKNNSSLFKADLMQKEVYEKMVDRILDKFAIEEKYKKYVFDFFLSGIQSVISNWLKSDCDLDVQIVADIIKSFVSKDERIVKKSEDN